MVPQISTDGDESLGLPTKPKKSLDQKLNIKTSATQVWLYFIHRTTWPGYAGTTMNLHIVNILNTPKNLYLQCKSSHPKKYLLNFPTPKNPGIENFKPPPKFFDHPRHLKSRVPPGLGVNCYITMQMEKTSINYILHSIVCCRFQNKYL